MSRIYNWVYLFQIVFYFLIQILPVRVLGAILVFYIDEYNL